MGDVGDFIYTKTDGLGDLTTNDTGKPVFLKVANAITSLITGSCNGSKARQMIY